MNMAMKFVVMVGAIVGILAAVADEVRCARRIGRRRRRRSREARLHSGPVTKAWRLMIQEVRRQALAQAGLRRRRRFKHDVLGCGAQRA